MARLAPHRDTYISPQVEQMLGFAPIEWLANPLLWVERLHPEDRERTRDEFASSRAQGRPFRSEYRLLRKDGCPVWVRDEARVVQDPGGGPSYLLGMLL